MPTHFFKAVLAEGRAEDGADQVLVGAWVMPNALVRTLLGACQYQPLRMLLHWSHACGAQIEPDTPLMSFTVPISALEDVAGARRPAVVLWCCGAGMEGAARARWAPRAT